MASDTVKKAETMLVVAQAIEGMREENRACVTSVRATGATTIASELPKRDESRDVFVGLMCTACLGATLEGVVAHLCQFDGTERYVPASELESVVSSVRNLIARIDRDGGRMQEGEPLEMSLARADAEVVRDMSEIESLRKRVAELEHQHRHLPIATCSTCDSWLDGCSDRGLMFCTSNDSLVFPQDGSGFCSKHKPR